MIQWASLPVAAVCVVGSVFLFRAWRRAPETAFLERNWLADWRRQRLAIFAYACAVFATLAFADFIGLFD
jgi:hypothetical protein